MSTKTKIILVSVILSLFTIAMIIIIVTRKPVEEEVPEGKHDYAVNDIHDATEEDTEDDSIEYKVNEVINNREVLHLDRLTQEQLAAKTQMYSLLHNRVSVDETDNKKVVSEEISEATTKFDVFINVTFSDGTTATYVVGYDATSMHKYLRCVSYDEYIYFNSEENCG